MEQEKARASAAELKALRILGLLLLAVGLIVNPWLVARLKGAGEIGPGLALFVLAFEACLVAVGGVFLVAKRKIAAFRAVVAAVSLIAWGMILLCIGEIYLATRPVAADGAPYVPFRVQHPHPFYLFSLPSSPADLARANNTVVSVTPEGFRGTGPERRGKRQLAFIVGGSAAFGDGASNDQTTISGYLNGLQDEYFFVNAGVPSWNSTQEFYRVSMQLLKYKPALIVVYDGANDSAISRSYAKGNSWYPAGTPESFGDLAEMVDDIRAARKQPLFAFSLRVLYAATFPRTRMWIAEKMDMAPPDADLQAVQQLVPPDRAEAGADAYLWNIDNMHRLASARDVKLIVFWQAIYNLHQRKSANDIPPVLRSQSMDAGFARRFHRHVVEHRNPALQFHDLADVFDKHAGDLQLRDAFIDNVHLTDRGNRVVAAEIWSRVSIAAKRPATRP